MPASPKAPGPASISGHTSGHQASTPDRTSAAKRAAGIPGDANQASEARASLLEMKTCDERSRYCPEVLWSRHLSRLRQL